jgi:hypothetical protein
VQSALRFGVAEMAGRFVVFGGRQRPRCLRFGWQRCLALVFASLWGSSAVSLSASETKFRVATFNCSLNREESGQLSRDLAGGTSVQARKVARILRKIRPDIVLLNEFDFEESGTAVRSFLTEYLQATGDWVVEEPLTYEFTVSLPVNTGVPTDRDLDHDGQKGGPADAVGFGKFPGQYGMLVLSRFPLRQSQVRTFRNLLWKSLPNPMLPLTSEGGKSWYSAQDLDVLALSSKSHWDLPFVVGSQVVHILASHPTPPAFDGAEDRNGRRNHDEIRFWKEYLTTGPKAWIIDDAGVSGGMAVDEQFVILGDLNADPVDGGSVTGAIQQLLQHPRVNAAVIPQSDGAEEAAKQQGQANLRQQGNARHDTADFSDRSVGNLRADYVLPSSGLKVRDASVFWPLPGSPDFELIDCSDHRLVWMDLDTGSP